MVRDATGKESGSVRYPSLSNRRESLDAVDSSALEGVRAMVDRAEKVLEDP